MGQRGNEFLKKLADLLDEYNAEIIYTRDDDGLHVSVDDEEIYVGWMHRDLNGIGEIRKMIGDPEDKKS